MYTQRQVNKIFAHIPSKTLRWWGLQGLYGWVNETSDGRGIHREYELANLYQIGLVEHLADLNIPSGVIKSIMLKYFRYGIRMTPPAGHPDWLDEKEWPEANILEQMNKFLVIKKLLYGVGSLPGQGVSPVSGWGALLVNNIQEAASTINKENSATLIFVNLSMIKEYTDQLIQQT